MSDPIVVEEPDQSTVDAFSTRLEDFARALPEREQRILSALLYAAMDPLDRMQLREGELLSDGERALLEKLEDGPAR